MGILYLSLILFANVVLPVLSRPSIIMTIITMGIMYGWMIISMITTGMKTFTMTRAHLTERVIDGKV